jgi:sugar phosphate isomerase/epimerase
VHERISVNTLCFMGTPFSELVGYWRELQPHRVGIMTSLLFDQGPDAAQAALATGDYRVDVLSHQFMAGHLTDDEASWTEPRQRLSQAIAMGREMGARCLYMAQGGHGEGTWEDAAARFTAAIAPCLPEAAAAGIALMIETSNPLYASSQLAHNLRDTITLAEMAGIGVCIDIIACWTEAGLRETIERAMPRCHLIQVGDWRYGDRMVPSRSVPGDGVIPLERICGWALDAGFVGAFDLELLGPRIDEEGRLPAVGRAARYVTDMLQSLGA